MAMRSPVNVKDWWILCLAISVVRGLDIHCIVSKHLSKILHTQIQKPSIYGECTEIFFNNKNVFSAVKHNFGWKKTTLLRSAIQHYSEVMFSTEMVISCYSSKLMPLI